MIICFNPVKTNDVPEIPRYNRIHPSDSRRRHMCGIIFPTLGDDTRAKVGVPHPHNLIVQNDAFDRRRRHSGEDIADLNWCRLQLIENDIACDQDQTTLAGEFEQPF